jgi:branched-chain amino acid transport system ATP-binding protein
LGNQGETLLRVDGLGKRFGGIQALSQYGLNLETGALAGLIGPNGAGKTTVFNLLSGVLKPSTGHIFFRGRDITGQKPFRNARLGLARTFQNIRLFNDLSVEDNVRVALHMHLGRGFWPTIFNLPVYHRAEAAIRRQAEEFIALTGLTDVRDEPAGNLPYGRQRRVEIARALAARPRLLLLDEPAAGMNPHETEELVATIRTIHEQYGLTILLVEHDMSVVMSICRTIQVLVQGRLLTSGSPRDIQSDPRVIEAYLGTPRETCHA